MRRIDQLIYNLLCDMDKSVLADTRAQQMRLLNYTQLANGSVRFNFTTDYISRMKEYEKSASTIPPANVTEFPLNKLKVPGASAAYEFVSRNPELAGKKHLVVCWKQQHGALDWWSCTCDDYSDASCAHREFVKKRMGVPGIRLIRQTPAVVEAQPPAPAPAAPDEDFSNDGAGGPVGDDYIYESESDQEEDQLKRSLESLTTMVKELELWAQTPENRARKLTVVQGANRVLSALVAAKDNPTQFETIQTRAIGTARLKPFFETRRDRRPRRPKVRAAGSEGAAPEQGIAPARYEAQLRDPSEDESFSDSLESEDQADQDEEITGPRRERSISLDDLPLAERLRQPRVEERFGQVDLGRKKKNPFSSQIKNLEFRTQLEIRAPPEPPKKEKRVAAKGKDAKPSASGPPKKKSRFVIESETGEEMEVDAMTFMTAGGGQNEATRYRVKVSAGIFRTFKSSAQGEGDDTELS